MCFHAPIPSAIQNHAYESIFATYFAFFLRFMLSWQTVKSSDFLTSSEMRMALLNK